MTIDELKKKVADYHAKLEGKEWGNKAVTSNKHGPIGIGIIDHVVDAMEALEKRIAALEKPIEKPNIKGLPPDPHGGYEGPNLQTPKD